MVTSCRNDLLVVTTSAASTERRKRPESKASASRCSEGADGRADLPQR